MGAREDDTRALALHYVLYCSSTQVLGSLEA